ncbi:hypothetical protein O0I10_007252 [Lichtheimia ornata]|uniref:Uncharacterized protein n=1 Tax=Lichtheimia ornata TaxID=688661 RepID=A0AAD7Y0G8_9FUNG|nr:uncharacterized protein O0I10_007252 [Lichtheimia ornata]KAJ8657172.1 hypothetical protein O0I10_007252 [Lichtheimia ornata]
MLQSMLGSLIVGSLFLVSQQAQAAMVIQVADANNFCTFLPPTDSTDRLIADSETEADAFCMGSTPKATGADSIPSGFIQSAHFVATDDYVQVTGQIDPSKANLDPTDGGGQYDVKAPDGASCAGYEYFVNLIEPSSNTYCIRCCNSESDCNRGISEAGCERIVPGDYSGPMGAGSGESSDTPNSSAAPSSTDSSSPSPADPSRGSSSSGSSNPNTPSSSSLPSPSSSPSSDSGSSPAATSSLPSDSTASAGDSSSSQSSSSSSSDESVSAQSVDESAANNIGVRSMTSALVAVVVGVAVVML